MERNRGKWVLGDIWEGFGNEVEMGKSDDREWETKGHALLSSVYSWDTKKNLFWEKEQNFSFWCLWSWDIPVEYGRKAFWL